MRTGELNFLDKLFDNELNYIIAKTRNAYENMLFSDVARLCINDLQTLRDEYSRLPHNMHKDLLIKYIET